MAIKKKELTPEKAELHRKDLQDFFSFLSVNDVYKSESGFSADKEAILKVFKITENETVKDILVRLTLIDSMYSTQMNRRYYALDDLANVLFKLSKGKQGELNRMFVEFTKDPDNKLSLFDYKEIQPNGNEITKNLFAGCYGIGKDGNSKGAAISLISKYAYFETNFNFPIYDSIACEMFPLVWHHCGFEKSMPKLIHREKGKVLGDKTIVDFIKAINLLIGKLDSDKLTYDLLDRFLWFVGKICRGNLSLVLTKEEYMNTLEIYPPKKIKKKNKKGEEKVELDIFNVAEVDINKLTFLKDQITLRKFFEFAKYYKE